MKFNASEIQQDRQQGEAMNIHASHIPIWNLEFEPRAATWTPTEKKTRQDLATFVFCFFSHSEAGSKVIYITCMFKL